MFLHINKQHNKINLIICNKTTISFFTVLRWLWYCKLKNLIKQIKIFNFFLSFKIDTYKLWYKYTTQLLFVLFILKKRQLYFIGYCLIDDKTIVMVRLDFINVSVLMKWWHMILRCLLSSTDCYFSRYFDECWRTRVICFPDRPYKFSELTCNSHYRPSAHTTC